MAAGSSGDAPITGTARPSICVPKGINWVRLRDLETSGRFHRYDNRGSNALLASWKTLAVESTGKGRDEARERP